MGTQYPDMIKITEMARNTPIRENIERNPDLIKITEMARNTPLRENIERYPDLIKISEVARNTPLCEIIECALILGAGRYGSGEETRWILPKKKIFFFRFHNSWLVGCWLVG